MGLDKSLWELFLGVGWGGTVANIIEHGLLLTLCGIIHSGNSSRKLEK